jgi:hypothetical protein
LVQNCRAFSWNTGSLRRRSISTAERNGQSGLGQATQLSMLLLSVFATTAQFLSLHCLATMIHSLIRSMRASHAADTKQREQEDARSRQLKVRASGDGNGEGARGTGIKRAEAASLRHACCRSMRPKRLLPSQNKSNGRAAAALLQHRPCHLPVYQLHCQPHTQLAFPRSLPVLSLSSSAHHRVPSWEVALALPHAPPHHCPCNRYITHPCRPSALTTTSPSSSVQIPPVAPPPNPPLLPIAPLSHRPPSSTAAQQQQPFPPPPPSQLRWILIPPTTILAGREGRQGLREDGRELRGGEVRQGSAGGAGGEFCRCRM